MIFRIDVELNVPLNVPFITIVQVYKKRGIIFSFLLSNFLGVHKPGIPLFSESSRKGKKDQQHSKGILINRTLCKVTSIDVFFLPPHPLFLNVNHKSIHIVSLHNSWPHIRGDSSCMYEYCHGVGMYNMKQSLKLAENVHALVIDRSSMAGHQSSCHSA